MLRFSVVLFAKEFVVDFWTLPPSFVPEEKPAQTFVMSYFHLYIYFIFFFIYKLTFHNDHLTYFRYYYSPFTPFYSSLASLVLIIFLVLYKCWGINFIPLFYIIQLPLSGSTWLSFPVHDVGLSTRSNLIASAYCVRSAGGSPKIQMNIHPPVDYIITRTNNGDHHSSRSEFRVLMGKWSKSGGPLEVVIDHWQHPFPPPSTHTLRHYQPPNNHHRSPSHLSSRKGISARKGTASGWLSNNLPPRCIAAGCSPVWVWWGTTQQ